MTQWASSAATFGAALGARSDGLAGDQVRELIRPVISGEGRSQDRAFAQARVGDLQRRQFVADQHGLREGGSGGELAGAAQVDREVDDEVGRGA